MPLRCNFLTYRPLELGNRSIQVSFDDVLGFRFFKNGALWPYLGNVPWHTVRKPVSTVSKVHPANSSNGYSYLGRFADLLPNNLPLVILVLLNGVQQRLTLIRGRSAWLLNGQGRLWLPRPQQTRHSAYPKSN